MIRYVLGFLFDMQGKKVVLIKKNKPAFMIGKLNGVGGKIDATDKSPADAMAREFKEETGSMRSFNWIPIGVHSDDEHEMHVFASITPHFQDIKTMEDEMVSVFDVNGILNGDYVIMENLTWLIPFAINRIHEPLFHFISPPLI